MLQRKVNLLLVDDDDVLRQTLHTTFAALGYGVRTAADGFGALDSMREQMPDILLSDLQMPRMSGFELLSVVQRRFPALSVVAMSGAFSGQQVPEGVAAHAFHSKGSSSQALFQTIDAMAARSRKARRYTPGASNLIWISRNVHDCSGQSALFIACPQCLRTFPERLKAEEGVQQSSCIYCGVPLRYAIVQAAHTVLRPQAVLRACDRNDRTFGPGVSGRLPS